MEDFPQKPKKEWSVVPTISAAITNDYDLIRLREYIDEMDEDQRSYFVEGLNVAEQVLKLDDESIDLKTAFKIVAPRAISAGIAYLVLSLLVPEYASTAAIGGAAWSALDIQIEYEKKKLAIERLGMLREAFLIAGKTK